MRRRAAAGLAPARGAGQLERVQDELAGRVLLLGDVHAEDETLARILAQHREDCRARLCVGDIADGRGDLEATVALLSAARVQCVRGNHDRWALAGQLRQLEDCTPLTPESRAFLAGLPVTRRYGTPRGELLLCHAAGEDDMPVIFPEHEAASIDAIDAMVPLLRDPSLRFMVFGHTHRFMLRVHRGLRLVNPGTLRRGLTPAGELRRPTWGVLDFEAGAFERWVWGEGGAACEEVLALP